MNGNDAMKTLCTTVLVLWSSSAACAADPTSQDRLNIQIPRQDRIEIRELQDEGRDEFLSFGLSLKVDASSPTGFYIPHSLMDAAQELLLALPADYVNRIERRQGEQGAYFYDKDSDSPYIVMVLAEKWQLLEGEHRLSQELEQRYLRNSGNVGRALFLVLSHQLAGFDANSVQLALKQLEQLAFIEDNDRYAPLHPRPEQCGQQRVISRLIELGAYQRVASFLQCGSVEYMYLWDTGWVTSDDINYRLLE
jgi:hypothetical protein